MANAERLMNNPYPAEYVNVIIDSVCKNTNVEKKALISKCRQRELADARKIVVYLSEKYVRVQLWRVAEQIGLKGHTAVTHQKNACESLMKFDTDFRNKVELVKAECFLN